MAIASTLLRRIKNVIGDRKVTIGTYEVAGAGAEIDTNLAICEFLFLQGTATPTGAASTGTVEPVVNVNSFPIAGTAVPYVAWASGGNWLAYGR